MSNADRTPLSGWSASRRSRASGRRSTTRSRRRRICRYRANGYMVKTTTKEGTPFELVATMCSSTGADAHPARTRVQRATANGSARPQSSAAKGCRQMRPRTSAGRNGPLAGFLIAGLAQNQRGEPMAFKNPFGSLVRARNRFADGPAVRAPVPTDEVSDLVLDE